MDQDNFTETARALEEEDFCVQDPKNGKEPRVAHSAQAGMCPGRPCSGGGQHDLWKKASDGPLCREGVSAVDRAGSRGATSGFFLPSTTPGANANRSSRRKRQRWSWSPDITKTCSAYPFELKEGAR